MRINVGKLSYEVTDKYGWDVDKATIRHSKINEIIGETDGYEDCLYNITLQDDQSCLYKINLDFSKNKLDIFTLGSFFGESKKDLRMTFNCDGFSKAEELIKMIMEGNDLSLTLASTAE